MIAVTDRDGVFGPAGAGQSEPARLSWTYADHPANDTQARDPEVDRAVARLFAAKARQEAVIRNRAGDFVHARSALSSVAERIRSYAGRDPELRELVKTLETEQGVFAAPMAEASRKSHHFASANLARTRDAGGHAVKRS